MTISASNLRSGARCSASSRKLRWSSCRTRIPFFTPFTISPQGLPKIHEHSGGPPKAFGIVWDGRLAVLFTFDTDLGDGLEDEEVHKDPPEKRDAAMRMALNIVQHALTN